MNYDSPADIRAELERRGLTLKKRWGQNFLINRGARERLIALLDPRHGESVWEIGPGLGAMTELLLARGARCTVFEVDRGLCRFLEEEYVRPGRLVLVSGDFLETWEGALQAGPVPSLVIGNLPYRSASLMITALIDGELRARRMVFTVQKELAERMSSDPGKKSYSSFSVLCQAAFEVKEEGDLRPGSFYPAPDVVSTVVALRPRADAPSGAVLEMLQVLLRGLFASRRKTLRNNAGAARLPQGVTAEILLEALEWSGAAPGSRAEEHSPEVFVRAARSLAGAMPGAQQSGDPRRSSSP